MERFNHIVLCWPNDIECVTPYTPRKTGSPVPISAEKLKSKRAAAKLIEQLTVEDPDMVPPVSKRRGLPVAEAVA